jgi:type II secretion system protein N
MEYGSNPALQYSMVEERFMSRKTKWFGYIVFCVIITVCFLYLLFPSEAVKDYVISAANAQNIPVVVSVDRIRPWPALGLKVDGAEISLKKTPAHTLFQTDSLILRPEIWSLVKGSGRYSFTCQAYGGEVKGWLQFRHKPPFQTEMEVHDIRIGGHTYLEELAGRRIEGNLSGTLYFTGQPNNLLGGNGKANLRLLDGAIELLLPLLELDSIAFDEISVDMMLRKSVVTIARCELSSSQLEGSLSGDIRLRKQIERSAINLKGEIKPFASFFTSTEGRSGTMNLLKKRLTSGALRFVIRGTLREPKIRFI